jgi:hypothetical protein
MTRSISSLADRHEQLQALPGCQALLVAVARDRHALDQLHHEVRPAVGRRAGVMDLGDVGVVHQRQRLPLGLEPRQHLPRVHPRLDKLDGHRALDRLGLLRHPHRPHAPLADLLQELVASGQHHAALLRAARSPGRRARGIDGGAGACIRCLLGQEPPGLLVGP